MPPDQLSQNSGVQIAIFRHRVSEILLHNTIYDVVPVSSKIAVLDARLPVKQAFKIMHDEGLSLVPLWDDQQQTVTGMLTASDFVLILRKLQRNIRTLGHEELEMHSVSAWKEAKLQFYGGPDVAAIQRRPLIHVYLHLFPRYRSFDLLSKYYSWILQKKRWIL
jgi:5'-AMP-activated protein kinase regulatory gamma subunit